MLVCFLVFHRLTRKHLVILTDLVFGCITFSEAPHLAVVPTGMTVMLGLCNLARQSCGEPAKPK
jgi:hypothetical protein